jgi:uncharacterized DUF497 family protein
MNFEYDENKSQSNKTKHGIDFEEAKKLFLDTHAIVYPSQYTDEERFYTTGLIDDKFYTSIITFRGENIRIISTRRARKKEIEHYERLKDADNNS